MYSIWSRCFWQVYILEQFFYAIFPDGKLWYGFIYVLSCLWYVLWLSMVKTDQNFWINISAFADQFPVAFQWVNTNFVVFSWILCISRMVCCCWISALLVWCHLYMSNSTTFHSHKRTRWHAYYILTSSKVIMLLSLFSCSSVPFLKFARIFFMGLCRNAGFCFLSSEYCFKILWICHCKYSWHSCVAQDSCLI